MVNWELVAAGGDKLGGLAQDPPGASPDPKLYVVSSGSGEVMQVDRSDDGGEGKLLTRSPTGGYPSDMAFDATGALFVADFAHKSIVSQPPEEVREFQVLVGDYEGKQFWGPNSLCFDNNGTLFFTDSGPMGDTSLANPKGSVYCVSHEDQLLKPLALECLAHPSGIAASPDGSVVYVAETMANRILRFVKRINGVFLCSVYYSFNGGFGPTALACDSSSRLYVARFDFSAGPDKEKKTGRVAVIDDTGKLLTEVDAPGPEIAGMMIQKEKDDSEHLFLTEQSEGKIFCAPVNSLFDDGVI